MGNISNVSLTRRIPVNQSVIRNNSVKIPISRLDPDFQLPIKLDNLDLSTAILTNAFLRVFDDFKK